MNTMSIGRLRAVGPILLDISAPVVSFFLLHTMFGLSAVLALTVGAAVAGVRTLYGAIRLRRVNAFSMMLIVLLVATLALVAITGDARLVLAKSAVVPFVGGCYGVATNFVGRALIFDVIGPFVTKGIPALTEAWERAWHEDSAFRGRIRLLNLLWGIGFILSAAIRVFVIYAVPLDIAVLAGQLPTLVSLVVLFVLTWSLAGPLRVAVRRLDERTDAGERAVVVR